MKKKAEKAEMQEPQVENKDPKETKELSLNAVMQTESGTHGIVCSFDGTEFIVRVPELYYLAAKDLLEYLHLSANQGLPNFATSPSSNYYH